MECISREAANDKKATLGELIKKYKGTIPPPLDIKIEKAWGYSSEQGRHLKEARDSEFDEAELLVTLAAGHSTYMVRKLTQMATEKDEAFMPFDMPDDDDDDLPF
ncbi:hypothetical protein [Dyadobacter koreensis]|uniref:hypothetical protein n=1 Tax=Dyadobacter koreensis TaxID=408657 RepID=UPI000B88A5F4|nr:hypothetical protein [Dyadobacter koreensis]